MPSKRLLVAVVALGALAAPGVARAGSALGPVVPAVAGATSDAVAPVSRVTGSVGDTTAQATSPVDSAAAPAASTVESAAPSVSAAAAPVTSTATADDATDDLSTAATATADTATAVVVDGTQVIAGVEATAGSSSPLPSAVDSTLDGVSAAAPLTKTVGTLTGAAAPVTKTLETLGGAVLSTALPTATAGASTTRTPSTARADGRHGTAISPHPARTPARPGPASTRGGGSEARQAPGMPDALAPRPQPPHGSAPPRPRLQLPTVAPVGGLLSPAPSAASTRGAAAAAPSTGAEAPFHRFDSAVTGGGAPGAGAPGGSAGAGSTAALLSLLAIATAWALVRLPASRLRFPRSLAPPLLERPG